MRLLFILSEYLPESGGGIITFYANLLPRLVREGHAVEVLVASSDTVGRESHEIDGVGIRYLDPKLLTDFQSKFGRFKDGFDVFPAFLPLAWAAFEQSEAAKGFDVVEVTDWQLLFAPWVVEESVPVVIALHSSIGQMDLYEPISAVSACGDLVRMIELEAVRSADGALTNSRLNAREWQDLAGCQVDWIPPVVSLEDRNCETNPAAKAIGITVARLQNWKGVETLCRALQMTREDVQIEWFGAECRHPSGLPMAQYLAQTYPDVFGSKLLYRGKAPNASVRQAMREAAFACVPSEWDVFNMTVIEAITEGIPVVCSDGAGAEFLFDPPGTGFRFGRGDSAGLAACLDRVVKLGAGERATMVRNARIRLGETTDPTELCSRRIEYYGKIAAAQGSTKKINPWLRRIVLPGLAEAPRRRSWRSAAKRLLKSFGASR